MNAKMYMYLALWKRLVKDAQRSWYFSWDTGMLKNLDGWTWPISCFVFACLRFWIIQLPNFLFTSVFHTCVLPLSVDYSLFKHTCNAAVASCVGRSSAMRLLSSATSRVAASLSAVTACSCALTWAWKRKVRHSNTSAMHKKYFSK